MKKLILAAVLAMSLSGCFYQNVSHGDIQWAEKFCSDNGGINHITADFTSLESVTCQDETYSRLHIR